MPKNTDQAAQQRRRKEAIKSAVCSCAALLCSALVLLGLRRYCHAQGLAAAVLLILAILDLGGILPVWIVLKIRLKEIEGGEEDAAAQY